MSRRHPERDIVFIGAYHGKSLLSSLIRWRTWSEISHVAAIRADGQVIEAWSRGGVRHLDSWHKGHTPGTRIDLYEPRSWSMTRHRKYWDWLLGQVGKKYDWLGVLGFLTRRDGAHSRLKWFCSEKIQEGSVAVGDPFLVNVPSHRVYPGQIPTSPVLSKVAEIEVGDPTQNPDLTWIRKNGLGCPVRGAGSGGIRP